jgi:2-methylcitrate dehydratase PrpD
MRFPKSGSWTLRKLMKKITLRADAELSAVFPKKRPARVTIGTYDGREFQHFQPYRKGDREEPLSDADLNNKFDELVAPVIGLEAARSLRDKLWQIDELPVRQLKFANFRAQESKRHQQ